MSERQTIVLNYTPLESGNAESRWIRVEQETPEDESLSVAEAASVIDSIYEIEPCDDGMGGGGEGDDGTDAPDEDKVDAALAAMLARAGMCDKAKFWTATVRVYRSHRQPGYVLRSETATVETTEPVRESRRQEVEVSGAVIELDMPYDGGLTGIPAGVRCEVRGSTVNLDRPVNGRLVLRYNTYYERVTLRVPTGGVAAEGGQGAGVAFPGSGGRGGEVAGGEKPERAELQAAAVVAFWGDLAASCDLTPPEQDDADGIDIDRICNKGSGSGGSGDDSKDCWKTIAHYQRCNCSYKKVNKWEEQIPAPCDGAISGAGVGYEERFGGFVWCEGEEDEVSDPEYYEKRCCHPPPRPLPRCRKSYAVYTGGHEIENGPDHWRNIYGADVAMIAVLPEGGTCGEVVTEWNVPSKNCCDEVEPQEPRESNPRVISPGGAVKLGVNGGQNPRKWRASAGLTFRNGESYLQDGSHEEWVYASNDACEVGSVQVDDGCTKVHMPLTLEDGQREPMQISPDEATIGSGQMLVLTAYYARGEVQWTPGSLRLVSGQGTSQATFEAPEGFCGQTEVTATDACGEMATARVLSTQGHWEEVFDFDPCTAPWSGRPAARYAYRSCSNDVCKSGTVYSVSNYQGYNAEVCYCQGSKMGDDIGQAVASCPPSGSCSETMEDVAVKCGYTGGEEMISDRWGDPLWRCDPVHGKNNRECFPLCSQQWTCAPDAMGRIIVGDNSWQARTFIVERLWRWECP